MIYTLIFFVPIVAVVYLNLYMAVPKFLRKERYLVYILIFLLLLGGGALFLYFLFDSWIDLLLPDFYFISYYTIPALMLYTGVFMVLTTLLKLSRSWFMLLRFERMTTTYQLQSLQSQINPHFLLNSLQTIYALSLEKSKASPEVILQLSDILKYTLYETGQPTVELEKEIAMIRDYVDMYRYRVDPDLTDIRMEEIGDPEGLMIAPMLLIPFIENSFKHSKIEDLKNGWIDIKLKTKGEELELEIKNSIPEIESIKDKQGGIGLENVKRRLELIYPNKHNLNVKKIEKEFCVNLNITLSNEY